MILFSCTTAEYAHSISNAIWVRGIMFGRIDLIDYMFMISPSSNRRLIACFSRNKCVCNAWADAAWVFAGKKSVVSVHFPVVSLPVSMSKVAAVVDQSAPQLAAAYSDHRRIVGPEHLLHRYRKTKRGVAATEICLQQKILLQSNFHTCNSGRRWSARISGNTDYQRKTTGEEVSGL